MAVLSDTLCARMRYMHSPPKLRSKEVFESTVNLPWVRLDSAHKSELE